MINLFLTLIFVHSNSTINTHKIIDLSLRVYNRSLKDYSKNSYPAISAIKGDFIIRTFYPDEFKNPFIFKNLKIYDSADYYELVVSYKGVNYFKRIDKKDIIKEQNIDVYELGNKKNNINIKEIQYIVENDELNKRVFITQDVLIENNGDFVYSPILPQKDFIKIQLAKGVKSIIPNSNLSRGNYILKDNFLLLKAFLKPGENYFSFSYILDVDEYPFLIKTKAKNKLKKLTLLTVKTNTRVKSNLFSKFKIMENENTVIKSASKNNIAKNKDISFMVLGKSNFTNSFFVSNISFYKVVKSLDKYVVIFSSIIFILFLIIILAKEKNV